MKVDIDFEVLEQTGISADDFLYLYIIYRKGFNYLDNLNLRPNLENLQKSKLIKNKYSRLKLLGSGDIKKKFDVEVNFISKGAKDKIEKSGGKVTLIK